MKYDKGDYFIVPNRKALEGLDTYAQVIFLWICARANDKGICFPSLNNLAKTCGCSRDTVLRHLKTLENNSFIEKESGDSTQSNKYQIKLVKCSSRGRLGSSTLLLGSSRELLGVVAESDSNNNHINNNHEQQESLPDWLNKNAWKEWLEYRKEIGKSLKPSTVAKQLSLLEKNKKTHIEIIDRSITNGWVGLFPEKGSGLISKPLKKLKL